MSTTTPTAENAAEFEHRAIDHTRYKRACDEEMSVTPIAPALVTVEHNDHEHIVDLDGGACDCADALYRPETYCKHATKAALVTMYTDGVRTEFIARVARYAADHSCPSGNDHVCDGPTGPCFPCPECVEATGVEDWEVWQQTAKRTGARR